MSRQVADRRLRHTLLAAAPLTTPAEVVGWFGAVQAQEYGPAKWSLGQRVAAADDAEVERAFGAGALLRTHVLRPTWHFVRPADIRRLLRLTGPRVHVANAYQYRQLGLTGELRARTTALLAAALAGGRQLIRAELADLLAAAGFEASGLRLAYTLMSAELDGVICSGARRGRQHTYALLDERAPDGPDRAGDRDTDLAWLTRRYFTGHGPATARDFATWSGLTVTEVRHGLRMVADDLVAEDIDGVRYFSGPPPAAADPPGRVRLLQPYDEYVGGYSESKFLVDLSGDARRIAGDRPVFNSLVLLDGQLAGHWRRTVGSRTATVQVALYRPFDADERAALRAEADRHAAFLGVDASVRFGAAATPR